MMSTIAGRVLSVNYVSNPGSRTLRLLCGWALNGVHNLISVTLVPKRLMVPQLMILLGTIGGKDGHPCWRVLAWMNGGAVELAY